MGTSEGFCPMVVFTTARWTMRGRRDFGTRGQIERPTSVHPHLTQTPAVSDRSPNIAPPNLPLWTNSAAPFSPSIVLPRFSCGNLKQKGPLISIQGVSDSYADTEYKLKIIKNEVLSKNGREFYSFKIEDSADKISPFPSLNLVHLFIETVAE